MLGRRKTLIFTLLIMSTCVLFFTLLQNAERNSFDRKSEVFTQHTPNVSLPLALPQSKPLNKLCLSGSMMFEKYCILSPYENDVRNTSSVGLVTLCTQGTVEYLRHVTVLCHRWAAPISVAVYSPEEDYEDARLVVHLLRTCDLCVRTWVNWHFFIENERFPAISDFSFNNDCSLITQEKPKKRRSQGTYPINVGRNVARRLARTPYVFSSDIELYPSLDIPIKFERMLPPKAFIEQNQVWVLPVFEVHSEFRTPLTKPQLRTMFFDKQAISFHKYRCNVCHMIPNLTRWMEFEMTKKTTEEEDSLEPLRVFSTVKRNKKNKLQEWEPFFIGTTSEPEFDIRLSWEGKQNKMQVAYEMCIRNYDFHILENAFLVHTPGINYYNAAKEKFRLKHMKVNKQIMSTIKTNLIKKYKSEKGC